MAVFSFLHACGHTVGVSFPAETADSDMSEVSDDYRAKMLCKPCFSVKSPGLLKCWTCGQSSGPINSHNECDDCARVG